MTYSKLFYDRITNYFADREKFGNDRFGSDGSGPDEDNNKVDSTEPSTSDQISRKKESNATYPINNITGFTSEQLEELLRVIYPSRKHITGIDFVWHHLIGFMEMRTYSNG